MPVRWIGGLALLFLRIEQGAEDLRLLTREVQAQLQHDFWRFDAMPYWEHQPARCVNMGVAMLAKTAMAIAGIYFVVLIAANERCAQALFLLAVTTPGVQDFKPFQCLPQLLMLGSRVTDDASPKCSGKPYSKLQSSPPKWDEIAEQVCPAHTCFGHHHRRTVRQRLDAIAVESNASNHATHTSIRIENIAASPHHQQGPVMLDAEGNNPAQFLPGLKGDPQVGQPPTAKELWRASGS